MSPNLSDKKYTYKNKCPIVNWYEFYHCEIKTCKYYSKRLKSRCMKIERKETDGQKNISDAELHFYKFSESDLIKTASSTRKQAVSRVRSMLILYKFVEYIRENFKSPFENQRCHYSETFLNAIDIYPLNVEELKIKTWMLFYIFDESVYHRFINSNKSGDVKAFNHEAALSMSKRQFFPLKNLIFQEKQQCLSKQ